MELIPRVRNREAAEHLFPSHTLVQYLLIVVVALLGLATISTGVTTLGQSLHPPPNLFASFADVFPGQPASAVEIRGFLCSRDLYQQLPTVYCTLNPSTGAFSQVSVVVNQNVIDGISFRLREDTLRVGDLMVLWGVPTVSKYLHSVFFLWRDHRIFAWVTEYTGYFSLYLPVGRVSIGNNAALLTEYLQQ